MMKRIYLFVVLMSLTVSVQAQDRLSKPYLKTSLSYFSVESTDASWDYFDIENLGGGNTAYDQGVDKYDLEGDGFVLEVGVGAEVSKGFYVEGSLFYGNASLDGDATDQGYYYVTDGGGSVVWEDTYGSKFGDADTTLDVIGVIVDVNYDIVKLFDQQSKLSVIGGLGLGFSYSMLDDIEVKWARIAGWHKFEGDETLNLAWRLSLGAGYAITDSLSVNLTYQYMDLGSAESGKKVTRYDGATRSDLDNLEFDITAHKVGIGLNYTF